MISRLKRDDTLLLLLDVQTRLLPAIFEAPRVERNCAIVSRAARILGLPIIVTEQNPTRIGGTVETVAAAISDFEPIPKMRFSAWPDAQTQIEASGRKTVLLCGLESHICVLQSALDLIEAGYTVWIVEDAVSSRQERNQRIGMERLKLAGAFPTSVESALFELLQSADSPQFKAILALIK